MFILQWNSKRKIYKIITAAFSLARSARPARLLCENISVGMNTKEQTHACMDSLPFPGGTPCLLLIVIRVYFLSSSSHLLSTEKMSVFLIL